MGVFLSTAVLWVLVSPIVSAQTSWYVDGGGCDGMGSGTALDPFCTLQEAVDAAASGDTVIVRPGFYPEDVVVPAIQLAIIGEGGAGLTEVGGSSHFASIELPAGAELRLEGLSLSGWGGGLACSEASAKVSRCQFIDSDAGPAGGGIRAQGSDVAVRGCRFRDTTAQAGGAIAALHSRFSVEDCSFEGAWIVDSYEGGAIWLLDTRVRIAHCVFTELFVMNHGSAIYANGGELDLEKCLFEDNFVGDYAGTVAVFDGDASIRSCLFRDNHSSSGWGGALYVSVQPGFDVEISDCAFERNTAAEGGAVCLRRGFARLERCIFSGNHAGTSTYYERGHGGGLFVGGFPWEPSGLASASASRCVFVGNSAWGHSYLNAGRGGGVFGPVELSNCTFYRNSTRSYAPDEPSGGAVAGGTILANCIAWKNQPDQLEASTVATWSNIQQDWPGQGNSGLDPRFWDPDAGDLFLLPSSPCVDGGDPALSDPDGSRIDIGAYPFDPRHGFIGRRSRSIPGG